MFAAIFSSSSVSWLLWQLCLSLAAAFGGIIVLRGLWLEGYKEPESHGTIEEYRRNKSKHSEGIKWVFFGVLFEVIIAFGTSFRDGLEIHMLQKESARIRKGELEMAYDLYPRTIWNPEEFRNSLTNWAGMRVGVYVTSNAWAKEASFGISLAGALNMSKWNLVSPALPPARLDMSMAQILLGVDHDGMTPSESEKAQAACEALGKQLLSNGIPFVPARDWPAYAQSNSIFVVIGSRDDPLWERGVRRQMETNKETFNFAPMPRK